MRSIYQNNTLIEIRVDTKIDISTATVLQLKVIYPSGVIATWVGSRYLSTDFITYVTQVGDLNEIGEYVIRAYIEFGSTFPYNGDPFILEVLDATNAISDRSIIDAVNAFTYLSCQNEEDALTDTDNEREEYDLLYDGGSSNQGNFSLFSLVAKEQLDNDAERKELTFSFVQKLHAYAYLIQHQYEQKFRDWDAEETSIGTDITKRSKGASTSGWSAYISLLRDVERIVSSSTNMTIVKHNDEINYPFDFINRSDIYNDLGVI